MKTKEKLENGFYWVKIERGSSWTIMEWDNSENMWTVGCMPMFEYKDVAIVTNQRILPPDEKAKVSFNVFIPNGSQASSNEWHSVDKFCLCVGCGKNIKACIC